MKGRVVALSNGGGGGGTYTGGKVAEESVQLTERDSPGILVRNYSNNLLFHLNAKA